MIDSISVSSLKRISNPDIIDIRSIEKYNNSHIPNAHNIPMEKLLVYYDKYLNRNSVYYIYCQKGIQSKKVCQILSNLGYKVINITGGYEAFLLV